MWLEEEVKHGLQLNPLFQRGHVWSESQQITFIEFLLKGGKSNRTIYLNHPYWGNLSKKQGYNDFVCVDGLQRMTAVKRFLDNEIKVFNCYYKDFEDKTPVEIDLLINVNNLRTEKEVLKWYIEMNEGGTPHTNEEINKVKKMLNKVSGETNEVI
jgi:uncharacterized protein with ParB-like and HNH nuclease domain